MTISQKGNLNRKISSSFVLRCRGCAPTILPRVVLPLPSCPADNPNVETPTPAGNVLPASSRRGWHQDSATAAAWRTIMGAATSMRYLGFRVVPARSAALLGGRGPRTPAPSRGCLGRFWGNSEKFPLYALYPPLNRPETRHAARRDF